MKEDARPDTAAQVARLFEELVGLAASVREDRLRSRPDRDAPLVREVRSLLQAHDDASVAFRPGLNPMPRAPLSPSASPPGPEPGSRIGRYELEQRIGSGGMGVVYRALDPRLQRPVALKLLPAALGGDSKRRRHLLKEARAAASLDHPAICTVYEVDETADGLMFIAMALCSGETLAQRLERGPLPREEAVDHALQLLDGLDQAHAAGIVHRDIKPGNIMITREGQVKILDFGIALRTGNDATDNTLSALGTLPYMSPEQVRGEPVDARTDVWSFGVVLYEMLSGSRPFGGDNIPDLAHAILTVTPAPLPGSVAGTKLNRILDRALSKSTGPRYASMPELRGDLEEVLDGTSGGPSREAFRIPLRSRLPAELSTFVGRSDETRLLAELLLERRLVTLTGPGGAGKSRLALRVAHAVETRFESGVAFVPLASVTDPERVYGALAAALGIPENPARPVEETVLSTLARANLLLILDNMEQLTSAAPQVARLLAACAGVRILVSSRVALRISGEQEYVVPPLDAPPDREENDADALRRFPATDLFLERARDVRPGWQPTPQDARAIRAICRALDGLPLAIELAAARLRLLPPSGILERLGKRLELLTGGPSDKPARHQTLREAISWSTALLEPREQVLFRRLGVFRSGFTPDSATRLTAGLGETMDAWTGIDTLVRHSLLQRDDSSDEVRFRMLETIREYALEQLEAAGETRAAQHALADTVLAFAEQAGPQLTGPQQRIWCSRVDAEMGNIEATFQWVVQEDEALLGLRLAGAVWRYWSIRGRLQEGMDHTRRVLALPGAAAPTGERAAALNALGTLLHEIGFMAEAMPYLDECLDIWKATGNQAGVGTVLNHLTWIACNLGETRRAASMGARALALNRALGEELAEAVALHNQGWFAHYTGDYEASIAFQNRSLIIRRRLGDERGEAFALVNRAHGELEMGRVEQAGATLAEALPILDRLEERHIRLFGWIVLAKVEAERGEVEAAVRRLGEAIAGWRKTGNRMGLSFALLAHAALCQRQGLLELASRSLDETETLSVDTMIPWVRTSYWIRRGSLALARDEVTQAVEALRQGIALAQDVGGWAFFAEAFERLALAHGKREHWVRAARFLGVAQAAREREKIPRSRSLESRMRELRDSLEGALGAEEAGRQEAQGAAWSRDTAVLEAHEPITSP